MLKEFKAFISKGNVVDLAVGIIIGAAFSAIVSSLVKDIVMPIVAIIIGNIDFSTLSVTINNSPLYYGNFIQAVVNFLIIALVVFLMIKAINRFRKPKKAEPAAPPAPAREEVLRASVASAASITPAPAREEVLLEEIRDLLKENGKK